MSKKSASEKEESTFKHTLSTVCLLRALFEGLGCAIELHEKKANEYTELHSLDPRNYLFNGYKPIGPTARKSVQGRLLYHL